MSASRFNKRLAGRLIPPTLSATMLAPLGGCLSNPCDSSLLQAARDQLEAIRQDAPPLGAGDDIGLRHLHDWEALPRLRGDRYEQSSSYNRAPGTSPMEPGGKDFNNFIALSGRDQPLLLAQVDGPDPDARGLGGYVLASVDGGPGYVSRMFFTRFSVPDLLSGPDFFEGAHLGRFENEILRIYVDDLSQPGFVVPLVDLGTTDPFGAPFAGPNSSAVTCYTPISFTHSLRIVMDGLCPLNGYFYHVDVKRTEEPTRAFSARLAEDPDYAAAADLWLHFGQDPNAGGTLLVDDQTLDVPPDAAAAIFTDEVGGTIELLRFVFDAIEHEQLRQLQLRIFFEDAAEPAVDVPLDAFFGCREEIRPLRTLPMHVRRDGTGLDAACYLPMPFAERARVVLSNEGRTTVTLRASVGVDRTLPSEPWGYLHARCHAVVGGQPPGSLFEVIAVEGRGRYVGTFLFAAGDTDRRPGEVAASLNILEGNEIGIIDGEVRIRGTGTEDYCNGGFYFATGPFDHPLAAANYVKGGLNNDPGIASCCRWHVLSDTIDFQRSFVLRFQYASDNPALVVRYQAVAYYYLDRPDPGQVSGGNWMAP